MANSSISISSIVVTSVISVSVAVSSVSATATFPDASIGVSVTGQTINASYFIVPTTVLPEQRVNASDGSDEVNLQAELTKAIDSAKTDEALPSDSDPIFNTQLVKTDSVTLQENRVKVFTDFIDFDPSDADVDATPITIDESAAFDLSKSFTGADDVTPFESISNNPSLAKTDSVSTSEAINQLRPHINITDTATTSEAIDRFDVSTELTDTVSVTEETAKSFTQPNTDDVTAVQSNIKAFTSNIDFDLSDADVDPDPVTASDQINTFGVTKGLTDTASVVEATAKTVTSNSLADTASPTEVTAKNFTHGGLTDSLSAVEGIKLNPSIPLSDTANPVEVAVFNIQQAFSHTTSVTESINTSLILGESDHLYPSFAVAVDGAETGKVKGYHIQTNQASRYAELGHQLNEDFGMLNESVLFGENLDAVQFYDKTFIQDRYRFRRVDTSQVITHDGSVLNTSILAGASNDGIARRSFTGVLGSAEQLNDALLNTDTISFPDAINAGLLLNFIYTDTDDPELGGHYLNETPLCAGARF